jgi:hypothetical protein
MRIKNGEGKTEYGPGVSIELTGDEVATAIDAWLVAHNVHVNGSRTITVNGELCDRGHVYVDPEGFVVDANGKKFPDDGLRRILLLLGHSLDVSVTLDCGHIYRATGLLAVKYRE